MFAPEVLYRLEARDLEVSQLDPLFAQINPAAALLATLSDVVYTVPTDRVLVLQSAWLGLNPGAAQIATGALIMVRAAGTNLDFRLAGNYTRQGADVNMVAQWSGSLLIPPGWMIAAVSTFDAGANANAHSADVHGVLIPKANVQRV